MAGALSSSVPFAVGDLGSEQGGRRDSHTEHISVDITEVELRPSLSVGRGVRCADLDAFSTTEAKHLQERCVEMAMELFELKAKFDEQEKDLQLSRTEAEARERDFKEVQKVCEGERRSSKSSMRRVTTLEEANSKLSEENADLRLDKERLLGVVRRHKEAGRSESVAAHRDRIRKRNMSEKEVNRCDLASAKLGLKATRQENDRLLLAARRQASRVRDLEARTEVLARRVVQLEEEADAEREEKATMQQEALNAMTSERRAKSDMEHEALLRLEATERASCAERAEKEAREAREVVELEAKALRAQLVTAAELLQAKDSARAKHQGSVARYQKMIDSQSAALQATREKLLGEKTRRQESERQARLRHIAVIDSKSRADCDRRAPPESRATEEQQARRLVPARKNTTTRVAWT
eukprot:jgi/Undpi1/2017/HiC_scaffold_12.g05403.m1